ncbi:MAG: hypothetical protein M1371_03725 [Actinobacteria bacterium]|nr:hypothetical protein [Actinomycetota bacterium]
MNSKERVLISLDHKEPDRVPIYNTFTPEVSGTLSNIYKEKAFELDIVLGHDCMLVELGIFNGFYMDFSKDSYIDRWGIRWRKISHQYGCYMEMDEPPIKQIEDVYDYRLPNIKEEPFYSELKTVCKKYGKDFAIIGGSISIFENSWYLRGMENFLMDMTLNKEAAQYLMDLIMKYNLNLGFKILDAGVDILYAGDDVGMQTGLLISPDLWKEFLYPRWAELISKFKKRRPGVKVAFHSDGYILPLIDDLVEIGVDILNPVQPDCMDPAQIKKRYGDKLSIWGTIDVQHTLSFGALEDVEREVLLRLKTIAPGGGLILGSTHNVQPSENAVVNLQRFYKVVEKFGRYPINF